MRQLLLIMLTLLMFTACERSSGYSTSTINDGEDIPVEQPAKNWYVHLVAEVPELGLETRSTTLGELDVADATISQSLSSFGRSDLDIVFINPEGLDNGEYKAYYFPYKETTERAWRFTVTSSTPDVGVNLKWRGLYVLTPSAASSDVLQYDATINRTNPILSKMRIVDEETGRAVAVINSGQSKVISFKMSGKSRSFRWERLNEDVEAETVEAIMPKTILLSNETKVVRPVW